MAPTAPATITRGVMRLIYHSSDTFSILISITPLMEPIVRMRLPKRQA